MNEVWLSLKWVFQGACFCHIMTWCRCSSLILSVLQNPAISCTVLQNSIKLLCVVLFVLEVTPGVQVKEPFFFPHCLSAIWCRYHCARNLVETAKLSQRCFSKKCLSDHIVYQFHYDFWFVVLGSYTKKQVRGALHFFLCSNSVAEKSVVTLGNFLKGQKKRGEKKK